MAHHLDPAQRHARSVDVVEPRGDLVLDQVVERGRLDVVAAVGVVDAVGRRDRPAVVAVVPLVPPAVEDREVEPAVERRLHARRAARLVGPQRVVQPDVAAGVERLRHRDVVVRQEHDPVPHLGVVGEADDLLDHLLAALVGRVRLAGDHQLDRALGVQQQPLEPLRVAHHQGQSLVRRDAAREADRQHVGVEHRVDPAELGRGGTALLPRLPYPLAGVVDQPGAQLTLGGPEVGARDLVDDVPDLGVVPRGVAVGAGLRGELEHLARHPGRGVHAVGDRGDRHLVLVERRPEAVEHPAADLAVQQRDAVGALREPEAHHGHVEDAGVAALEVLGAERQDPVERHAGQRAAGCRSTARSGRAGTGRCPPAPGCAS